MQKLSLVFPIKPISKDNFKLSVPVKKNGKMICIPRLSDFHKEYELALSEYAIDQMLKQKVSKIPKTIKIWVSKLNFFFEQEPTNADFFNFGKSLFDSLNGVVYDDDNQIVGFLGIGKKQKDKDNPRIELELFWE